MSKHERPNNGNQEQQNGCGPISSQEAEPPTKDKTRKGPPFPVTADPVPDPTGK
jgi:hypothetical protein